MERTGSGGSWGAGAGGGDDGGAPRSRATPLHEFTTFSIGGGSSRDSGSEFDASEDAPSPAAASNAWAGAQRAEAHRIFKNGAEERVCALRAGFCSE